MFKTAGVVFCCLLAGWTSADRNPKGYADGSDLMSFVTRPDLRPPRYIVTKHHAEAITPGYFFVAHYPNLFDATDTWREEHVPYQTGATIYDGDGELIWSGASDYRNTNVFGFRSFMLNGSFALSFYMTDLREDSVPKERQEAGGVVLNDQYQEISHTNTEDQGMTRLDLHEFTVLPHGRSALASANHLAEGDGTDIGQGARPLVDYGFEEIDLETGKALFEWWPREHGIGLSESMDTEGMDVSQNESIWDWFHLNSADKNEAGDYLISGRHTSTVYKISGKDGSIQWRLGGRHSDFDLKEGVHFEWQHHVRFLFENETSTIISVFDNAGDDTGRNKDIPSQTSWGKIIHLDHESMTATLLRGFKRPDDGKSPKLGSVQLIGGDDVSNANVFVSWGEYSYMTEYDGDNRLIMEARLETGRMWTYRGFKLPWVGRPHEPIVLKALPGILDEDQAALTYYVSWNGATEVDSWVFYSGDEEAEMEKLATVKKLGFETAWTTSIIRPFSYVEGVDKNGQVLGRSNTTTTMIAKEWVYAKFEGEEVTFAGLSSSEWKSVAFNPIFVVIGLVIGALIMYGVWGLSIMLKRKPKHAYFRIGQSDESEIGSTELFVQDQHLKEDGERDGKV